MKLELVREESYYNSQKASESIQYLALAGIAIIWLFKSTSGENIRFNPLLFWALITCILSVLLGIIQYSALAISWNFHYIKESKKLQKINSLNIDDKEVEMPYSPSLIAWILFYAKLLLLLIGYILIFIYVSKILVIQ